MHQIRFRRDPAEGAYSAPPDPLAGFKGPTSKGRGKGKGRGRQGRGGLTLRGGKGNEGRRGRAGGDGMKGEGRGGQRREGERKCVRFFF